MSETEKDKATALAELIFEMQMKFEWTDDYEGSREWDSAQDVARAFLSSTPANPIVLEHPGGNTHIGWFGADAFAEPEKWIASGWTVSSMTPDESRAAIRGASDD